ncbi:MAG TPA: hypothetical protein VM900_08365 [Sphingomonas sp.]|nr:hypothetical protein [Sphingomonas sp.]
MSAIDARPRYDPAEVQGNILRGYRRSRVRHLILEVADAPAARRWLGAIVDARDGAPGITSDAQWDVKPDFCLNLGVTYAGLRALGVPARSLATFPDEFVAGMAARAVKIGDIGASAPATWDPPFADADTVHLIATIHADDVTHLDRAQGSLIACAREQALTLHAVRDGWNFDGDYVHFGYRDNISQPRFVGIHDRGSHADAQPLAPIGSVLLGYPTEYEGLLWTVPQPDQLGRNGSFNAFRILSQDVAGFEDYLDNAATRLLADPLAEELLPAGQEGRIGPGFTRHQALREVVAAKMCGRWRNGVPLASSPETPFPAEAVSLTDFEFSGGLHCPFGAHIRRSNPRGGTIVQRAARHTRRLVRRGIPYGPRYDPETPDHTERGLLGNFIGANLGAQFEALSCDWINLGLQDPRITGTNDPLLGANQPATSRFDIPLASGKTIRLHDIPRFVQTRGGAYTFLPSIPAIRYLAAL